MRVVFMGTPTFAVPSLRAVASRHDVAAVYTRPDRQAGRGREMRASAVKRAAAELGLHVVQPATLKGPAEAERLRALGPDAVCVVAYGAILPRAVLDVPALGCINVHASLLPRHRGAAPIERAVLEGDAETGVCVMRMDEGLDTGPVALCRRLSIEGRSASELRALLAGMAAEALLEVLSELPTGEVTWRAQDDSLTTYADKITAADVVLDPRLPAAVLARRVGASGESAVSRALVDGRMVIVEEAVAVESSPGAGAVEVSGEGLVLGTERGGLLVRRLTPAGKRSMRAADFARGARFGPGTRWVAPS